MNVKVLSKDKEYLELKLEGEDEGFSNWLVHKMLESKSVSFASGLSDHSITANPVLKIRAKDAKKELHKVLEDASKELEDLQKQVEQALPAKDENTAAPAAS